MSNGLDDIAVSRRKANAATTAKETMYSILAKTPAMGIATLGLAGFAIDASLTALGAEPGTLGNVVKDILPSTIEAVKEGGVIPFGVGFAVGLAKNTVLIKKTLHELSNGKTGPGTSMPMGTDFDGAKLFQVTCVDARREDNSGGAIPGSFAVLGAEIRSIIEAGINAKLLSPLSPIAADAAAGYYIGSNIITGLQAHKQLMHEVQKCVVQARAQDSNARIKILMEDHWDGCGAQGFTSIPSYLAKFVFHNKPIADLLGIPNEILGYMWANSVLPLYFGAKYQGQVSFGAVLKHSPMMENPRQR